MDVDQTNLLEAMKCHETWHVNPPTHSENVKVSKKATPVGGGGAIIGSPAKTA